MAWLLIPNNRVWEYDNAPPDPGANSPYRPLWLKQTAGVRTNSDGQKVFTKVRKVGSTVDTMGEIAKTYWDVKGDDLKFQMEVLIPSDDRDFTIPCQEDGGVAFSAIIDWGDGTTTTTTTYNGGGLTHTYSAGGTYTIKIDGTFPNIYFANVGDKDKVRKVLNLGHVGWTKLDNAFFGCVNLTEFSAGASDTSSVTTFAGCLQSCSGLTIPELGFSTESAQRFDAFLNGSNALTDAPGIEKWDITNLTVTPVNNLYLFIYASGKMTTETYDAMLIAWAAQTPLAPVGESKFGLSQFSGLPGPAATAREVLVNAFGSIVDGNAVPLTSAHTLAGASDWWDPIGIVYDGGKQWFTNPNPDQGAAAQPSNSGARACAFNDTGFTDVSVSSTRHSAVGGHSGPVVCINPDDTKFGLALFLEDFYGTGALSYVLWELGRQPDDLDPILFAFAPNRVEGHDVVLRMDVEGGILKCYADDVLITWIGGSTTYDISALAPGLLNSTLHGMSVDVNGDGPQTAAMKLGTVPFERQGNIPCGIYPTVILPL